MINPVDGPALIGAPVFTPQGINLGTIDSIILDPAIGGPAGPACRPLTGPPPSPSPMPPSMPGCSKSPTGPNSSAPLPASLPPAHHPHQRRHHPVNTDHGHHGPGRVPVPEDVDSIIGPRLGSWCSTGWAMCLSLPKRSSSSVDAHPLSDRPRHMRCWRESSSILNQRLRLVRAATPAAPLPLEVSTRFPALWARMGVSRR